MIRKIKEAMYLGLGAASLTQEKARKFAEDLKKRGIIDADQVSSVVEDILNTVEAHTERGRDELRKMINTAASTVEKRTRTTKKAKSSKKKTAKKSSKKKVAKKTVKKAKKAVKKVAKKMKKKATKKKAVKKAAKKTSKKRSSKKRK